MRLAPRNSRMLARAKRMPKEAPKPLAQMVNPAPAASGGVGVDVAARVGADNRLTLERARRQKAIVEKLPKWKRKNRLPS
jgi:hypothetical protein